MAEQISGGRRRIFRKLQVWHEVCRSSEFVEGDDGEAENLHVVLVARSRSRAPDDKNLVPMPGERHADLEVSPCLEQRVENSTSGKSARLDMNDLKTVAFQVGARPFFEFEGQVLFFAICQESLGSDMDYFDYFEFWKKELAHPPGLIPSGSFSSTAP